MEPPTPADDEELSRAEREALLGALLPGDWARANSLARMAAFGLADMSPDDVLQEALTDLLSLDRTWRRGVPPLVTLKVAMRGIVSNARKKAANAPIDQYVTVSTGEEEPPEGGPRPVHALDELSPADFADGREQLAWIERAVKGDDEVELVLMAWAMGYSGAEARSETGLDAKHAQGRGLAMLSSAKQEAAKRRLAAAKTGVAMARADARSGSGKPVTGAQAKAFLRHLGEAANSGQYTLAARQLAEMSDEAALAIYRKLVRLGAKPAGDDNSP